MVFAPFRSESRNTDILLILVWNRVWFSREILECIVKYANSKWILKNLYVCVLI